MYQQSQAFRGNTQYRQQDYPFYYQQHQPHGWERTYGLNGGGFGNLLGMGSSIAGALGHTELGGMLGMANGFVGKYGKHFTGLGNKLGSGESPGFGGFPGFGIPRPGGFGGGFPHTMSGQKFMGGGFPGPGPMGGHEFMGGGFPGAPGMNHGFFF